MRSSMHHQTRLNTALGLPHDDGINASDMAVRGFRKGFVSQAHGLVKKLFMVHADIIRGCGADGHSYFPRGS